MRLLVTGGCGFIGSCFVNSVFERADVEVLVNLDAMYYCARVENVKESVRNSNRYKFVQGNIRSSDLVTHVLNEYDITHVIHFAAQSHVQNSFEDSLAFTKDNTLGTHVLLECVRRYRSIAKFVHVSTDEVYGESLFGGDEEKKNEQTILCPTNPYAATKAAAELMAQAYQHSFGVPVIVTRGNNVYGPNQFPEKLIPRFIELLRSNERVTIQGDGTAVRSFMHVTDAARAYIQILFYGSVGEIYNVGCDDGNEFSVRQVADMLIQYVKPGEIPEKWIVYVPDRPFNDQRYYISNAKLRELGWEQRIDFRKGMSDLVQHYEEEG